MQLQELVRREGHGLRVYTSMELSKYFFIKYFSEPSRVLPLLFEVKELKKVSEVKWIVNSEYEVLRVMGINNIEYIIYKGEKVIYKLKFSFYPSNSGTFLEFNYEDYTPFKWFRNRRLVKKFNEMLNLLHAMKDMKCALP